MMNRPLRIWICTGALVVLCAADRAFQHWVNARIATADSRTAEPLDGIPFLLGEWYGRSVTIERTAADSPASNEYVRRDYTNSRGETVAVYLASYTGFHRNIPHGPAVCYPMSGWKLLEERRLTSSDGTDDCMMYVFSKDLDKHLVLYWHEVDGVRMAGPSWTRLRFARSLLAGRAGHIIQLELATPVNADGIQPALERLNSFRTRFDATAGDVLTGHDSQPHGGAK
ncbi:MAG TPA: EpsI family protein [Planctomycetota bacterium]|nr:EpsI family protein [Planctomycetota bacterium]